MQPKCFFILILLFSNNLVRGQFLKNLRYELGAGIGCSIGESTLAIKESKINPWTVQYYSSERYKYPSFRMRSAALHPLGSRLSIGVRSGVDIFYFERNAYGQLETYFAVPVELIWQLKAIRLNVDKSVFLGTGIGYKPRKKYQSFSTKQGGLMASAELFIGATTLKKSLYYKLGLEYANENSYSSFNPPPDYGLTNETMHMITTRKLLFVGIGYNF